MIKERLHLISKNDIDALSTALRRMQPLTITRALNGVKLDVSVLHAAPVWGVAMVVQVRVKEGRVEWVQTFETVEAIHRCFAK